MNEYKILFCENCKIIQKAYYNRLKSTFLTGNYYNRVHPKKFPTHSPPKKHTKRMNPWPICKNNKNNKQNQKNALKLFLQSRRPLLVMHPYRPLLAMWFRRAGHFSSSLLSSIIFCNRMFSSFKLIISFKSLFISLKSILFCIFKYVLYKFGLQSIIIYGNIIPA